MNSMNLLAVVLATSFVVLSICFVAITMLNRDIDQAER